MRVVANVMSIDRGAAVARIFLVCLAVLLAPGPARAELDSIEILERAVVADGKAFGNTGPYERLRGKLHFAVEATAPENQAVVDLRAAPRDAQGRVHFATDFELLRPLETARGNGRLLYEPPNRGNIGMLRLLNDAAPSNVIASADDVGTGFLMEQGYALLWTGWSWDVLPGGDRLRADLPVATDGARPLFGLVTGEITVTQPTQTARHTGLNAVGYDPAQIDDANAKLAVRDTALGARTPIPRERWHFGRKIDGKIVYDPAYITLDGGFKPGQIYTVTYAARAPRVAGLGMVAIRDALLFFHHDKADRNGTPNPLIETGGDLPRTVLAFGHSQSARLLATMIAQGFAADSRGRLAFEGAFLASAGAGKGSFNYRFAQPSRHASPDVELDFPTDTFPFTSATETDAVTGASGSILDKLNAAGVVPRVIVLNSATDYWTRAASLIQTTPDAATDLAADRHLRLYLVAGAAHSPAGTTERGDFAHCRNPLDYRPLLRALLLHLDGWVTLKKEPPPSAVPTIADGSLGKLTAYGDAMPQIPGLRLPAHMLDPPRLDFGPQFASDGIATIVPPKVGRIYPALVPMPDADGLDKAGIRMPAISVPLGTYTGWNPQNAATGAPDRLGRWDGSFMPFPRTENERIASNDPRMAIAERYPKRDAYVEAYAAATLALAKQELIIGPDINPMIERAGALYDRLMARDPASEGCAF